MKRLVYSPKAYAFIRSENGRGGYDVTDVTDDIVSGTITRNVNGVSTAEIVLRNKNFKYSPRSHEPVFHPMDNISIWLQRVAGRPIQVFTGYLDSVPYYQMYPGNCVLTASCSLKKLMYTYFDPGLPTMIEWYRQNGWTMNASTGVILNQSQLNKVTGFGDGGYGALLRSFLIDICKWKQDSIWISDLPKELPKAAAKMYYAAQESAEESVRAAEEFFANLMTPSVSTTTDATTSLSRPDITVAKEVVTTSRSMGFDPIPILVAAIGFSGLSPTYRSTGPTANLSGNRRGLFAFAHDKRGQAKEAETFYNGVPEKDIENVDIVTRRFIELFRKEAKIGGLYSPDGSYQKEAIASWSLAANGLTDHTSTAFKEYYKTLTDPKTLQWAEQYAASASEASKTPTTRALNNIQWADLLPAIKKNPGQERIYQSAYSHAWDNLAAYYYVARKHDLFLKIPPSAPTNKDATLYVACANNDAARQNLRTFAGWAGGYASNVVLWDGLDGRVQVWNYGKSTATKPSELPQRDMVAITVASKFEPPPYWPGELDDPTYSEAITAPTMNNDAGGTPAQGTTQGQSGGFKISDVSQLAAGAAFTAQFSQPVDVAESLILSGNRALMNDIPVFEGVKQMCGASMRNFMSAPSGEFIAFFPDYFGAYGRKPYWDIHDIEITNMGIQMNDQALTTHVYVTGAKNAFGQITPTDKWNTQGVVDINTVWSTNDFISNLDKGDDAFKSNRNLSKAFFQNSRAFLERYGARPLRQDNPVIRSEWFEFLYAWQLFMLMWAKIYETRVDFTFQPEVMAGGRIRFPEHELEMYVESVSHSFNYESGFTTSATLTAPSTTNREQYPGFAIASNFLGGIGAASG